MITNDYLKENKIKLTDQLADIVVLAIEEVYPTYYESCVFQKWSNYKIVNYAFNLDLDEEDVVKVFKIASRYSKLWAFS